MSHKGQNLVEFLIIVAVVALGGIMILTLLGGNINEMLSKSVDKTSTYKPFDWETTSNSNSSSSSTTTNTTASTPDHSLNVNGVDVVVNTDGSASFSYKGQDVLLSATDITDMSTVIGTAGSSGTEILVAMIQDMIDKHKAEYAPDDVPVNIMSGKTIRTTGGGNKSAYGNAEVNLVAVKVGNNYKVYQSDKAGDATAGDFIIESTANSSNATITDSKGNPVTDLDGFSDKNNPAVLQGVNTYTDKATGKFYIIGQGIENPSGAGNDIPGDASIQPPKEFIDANIASFDCDDKTGLCKPRDKVWLLEFNPNE